LGHQCDGHADVVLIDDFGQVGERSSASVSVDMHCNDARLEAAENIGIRRIDGGLPRAEAGCIVFSYDARILQGDPYRVSDTFWIWIELGYGVDTYPGRTKKFGYVLA
jgi:hypothetical protein